MNGIIAIVKKDTADMFRKKRIYLLLLFSTALSAFLLRFLSGDSTILNIGNNQAMVDTLITVFLLAFTFLILPIFAEVLFLEERTSGSYETLLTTPLNISKIITGKALASFVFSYTMTILSVVGMLCSLYLYKLLFLIPSIISFVGVFIVIPIFSFSFIRLYGTFLFSMRNIQSLNVFRVIFIFGGIFGMTKVIPIILKYISPEYLLIGMDAVLLIISGMLTLLANVFISRLSNEEIFMNCQ